MNNLGLRTYDDLLMLQSLPLELKIAKTKLRIKEWYERYCGNVYVSFSGGKDSTVLLYLVRELYPDVPAVYVDTGLEYPEIKSFVNTFDNVIILKPKMNFKQVVLKYGYPVISKEQSAFIHEYRTTKSEKLKRIRLEGNKYGRGKVSKKWRFLLDAPFLVGDQCCDIMKKEPFKRFEKESGLHPFIGTMAIESSQRTVNWLRYGCNAFQKKRPTSQPLSGWTEQDILEYYLFTGSRYARDVYGDILVNCDGSLYLSGAQRTGCEFCLYGAQCEKGKGRLERVKELHPKRYDFIMRPVEENGLGYKVVIDYINAHSKANIRY